MKIEVQIQLKTVPINKEYETIISQFSVVLDGDAGSFLDLTDKVVALVNDKLPKKEDQVTNKILEILAQPPDRISELTLEDYAKIRQSIIALVTKKEPESVH